MKRALLWSLCLHGLLLLLILLLFYCEPQHSRVGSVLKAHLVIEPNKISHEENQHINLHQTIKHKEKVYLTAKNSVQKQRLQTKHATTVRQGYSDALLILLHNKIQTQINTMHYQVPDFLRNRTANVCFSLLPNGDLKNIQFQKSTRVSILDQLAQQAIIAIQPVHNIRKYLSHSQRFCMTFEFK